MSINVTGSVQTIRIQSGSTTSNVFTIQTVDKYFLFAPVALDGIATLQVSLDDGSTWRNPLTTTTTLRAGESLDTGVMALMSGIFHPEIKWRITTTVSQTANREFNLYGIK